MVRNVTCPGVEVFSPTQAAWPRRTAAPLALAACGAASAALAVADKVFGLVQRPFALAVLAYALLSMLLLWAMLRGIPGRSARLFRPSIYTGILLLNVLTAGLVFAWRVSADPTPIVLRSRLQHGDALLARGDKDGALLLYREAYRQFPGSYAVLMRMGAANYQVSDFEHARKYYSRAVEAAGESGRWRALNDLGQTYWKLGRPAEAIEYYEEARDAGIPDAEMGEWHYRMGWACFDLHDYDGAIHHYEAVAARGERYVAASYYNIACAIAQKVKRARTQQERETLGSAGIDSLRKALKSTASPGETKSLTTGLAGAPGERDPELEPLRSAPQWRGLLREARLLNAG